MADKIQVLNVNKPDFVQNVDAVMYGAMKAAVLKALPAKPPGLTLAELRDKLVLPEEQFPGGAKAGWWMMCVQLDLRAKGALARHKGSPVRLYRAP